MIVEVFSTRVQAYIRTAGYKQRELAAVMGIDPKVLSRKFRSSERAYFTNRDIHDLLIALVRWQAITKHEDLLDLLAKSEIDSSAIFRAAEWQESPLNTLTRRELPPPPANLTTPRHNIPAPTRRLIGRSWAVTRLQQLLGSEEMRLVTLIGPGGSGKTRLAQHVAFEMLNALAQKVWFVSFSSVKDPDMVLLTIAQALNIEATLEQEPLQSIITYLSRWPALLVLDNFEHLEEASGTIDDLLALAPGLKVLVTSRIVLHLPGEYEFSVPPLDLPDPALMTRLNVQALAEYSAIQLFVERAQAILPTFALTSENGALIAQICACVDGLPLALELAAARIRMLPPATLLERLSQALLPMLVRVGKFSGKHASDRHQTLSETIKWSYDLLDADEQAWFRRLGVFSGGWALESSEEMIREISASEQKSTGAFLPLDLLTQLANSSLLARVHNTHGYARFTMLSTLREYALERLEAHGEAEWLHDWHACYSLRKAEKGELDLRGPRQRVVLNRLTDARANLSAALEWSLHKAWGGQLIHAFSPLNGLPPEVANCRTLSQSTFPSTGIPALEISLRLATAMRAYWEWQGLLTEARHWLNAALELPIEDGAGPALLAARARALSEMARLMVLQNDQEKALQLAGESIALWRQLDDPPGLASALFHRAWALHGQGQYLTASEVYREALALLSPDRETWLYAQILLCLAATSGFTSDFKQARLYYARSRELFEHIGDTSAVADSWKDQGGILLLAGDVDEAITCLLSSIRICRELDHKQYIATALGSLSFAFGLRVEPDAETASLNSAQVQGAAESLMATIGLTPWTISTPLIQAIRTHIRERVTPERWQAALDAGRALTLEQALELVFHLAQQPQSET